MEFKELIAEIVQSPELHAKWLNTLSMMENTGARKISSCEHPVLVNEIILKHAAEESRHAYYLKKQIAKVDKSACPTYEFQYLLSPLKSYQYLHSIDVEASRMVKKELDLTGYDLRYAAYLLVTYAIEVRADALYPVYQSVLDEVNSNVNVKSIIAEEEGHLEEMIKQLQVFSPQWEKYAEYICLKEKELFNNWIESIATILKEKEGVA